MDDLPIEPMSNDDVLALAALQMPKDQQQELSDLLDRQRERLLSDDERTRLDKLMLVYRDGMRQKAEAIKIAVARGILVFPEVY